jgi:hypothetical protein
LSATTATLLLPPPTSNLPDPGIHACGFIYMFAQRLYRLSIGGGHAITMFLGIVI